MRTTPLPVSGAAPDPVIAANPIGQTVRTARGSEGLATATYEPSEQWRFRLSRVWDAKRPRCAFIMLNPSTATELVLDPTITRCVNFAKAWGYGALEVVNIFAYRATRPTDMKAFHSPVGDANNDASAAELVVAAWGTHGAHLGRGREVRELLGDSGSAVHLLRLTKRGHPGHPLYVRGDTEPTLWS